MSYDELNGAYWKEIAFEAIPGENDFPHEEFTKVVPAGSRVLDVGCGNGMVAELLAKQGYTVTAIDVNHDAIEANTKRATIVQYEIGDIVAGLRYGDETFDAITMSFVLVNFVSTNLRKKVVAEMTRVLKPGGIVWINEGAISKEYEHRYALCEPFVKDTHSFFVFKKRGLSTKIQTHEQLEEAVKNNLIERVAHHFTQQELTQLFSGYTQEYKKVSSTTSPRSKSKVEMITLVLRSISSAPRGI